MAAKKKVEGGINSLIGKRVLLLDLQGDEFNSEFTIQLSSVEPGWLGLKYTKDDKSIDVYVNSSQIGAVRAPKEEEEHVHS